MYAEKSALWDVIVPLAVFVPVAALLIAFVNPF